MIASMFSPQRLPPLMLLMALFALFNSATAQRFDANTYYQQCLQFEVGGDFETARQSCINALQANPNLIDAELALARIFIGLNNLPEARSRLDRFIRSNPTSAEAYVLQAEIALQERLYDEAEAALFTAQQRLAVQFSSAFDARRQFLVARLAEMRGNYSEALLAYADAITRDPLAVAYRLANAELRLRLGDAVTVQQELEAFIDFAGITNNPEVFSLLGQAYWATSDFAGAASNLERAYSLRLGNPRDRVGVENELRRLTLVYYGQGDTRSGGLALRDAMRRGNLLSYLLAVVLPWALLLLVLLALHLVAESFIEGSSSLEVVKEGPHPWTVGQAYGILFLSVSLAALCALVYGWIRYNNLLAIATPLQGADLRAFFLAAVAFLLTLFTLVRIRINGWKGLEVLLGSQAQVGNGIGIGLALFVVVLAYLFYVPDAPWLRDYYLNFSRLTPTLIAASLLLPLAELYFRAFVMPPLRERYKPAFSVLISSLLFALVLGSPLPILVLIGLTLSYLFYRTRDGITPLVAQLVLHLGLVLGAGFSGWLRSLFL